MRLLNKVEFERDFEESLRFYEAGFNAPRKIIVRSNYKEDAMISMLKALGKL
jgi:hypothetical protein